MNRPGQHSEVTTVIMQTMQYMAGVITLDEAAGASGVTPGVIRHLSSEYASYMLPRAARALRSRH